MATFNSVLIGKAKGKVGNVVLTAIKGQNIVKALNDKPANPRSVGQTNNRVQMSNAVLAYQFLALFLALANGLTKSTESVYNAFVRLVKPGMPNVLIASRVLAAEVALSLGVFFGNWFSVVSVTNIMGNSEIVIEANGVAWVNTMRYCIVMYESDGTSFHLLEGAVLEADFNAGIISVVRGFPNPAISHAYIYDTASNKITNIV